MLPRAILFDLDDTLFDHRHASAMALSALHRASAADLPFDDFCGRHAEVLEHFHQRFLKGEFSLDGARVARMHALFGHFGRALDDAAATAAGALYRREHQANRRLTAGARALLDHLNGRCRLGIVTNNSTAEQVAKLRVLGIASYFDAVVISEDAGVAKPDPRIFALALSRLSVAADQCVFVGDSWSHDVEGALAAGMPAVWLARDGQTPASMRLPGQKCPESRAGAGLSHYNVQTVASLDPLEPVLAAITTAFHSRTPGERQHEPLETLAT